MSVDQRASLKRIVNDDAHTKLSFKECEGIAKDLNLTLEQVCLHLTVNYVILSIMMHFLHFLVNKFKCSFQVFLFIY